MEIFPVHFFREIPRKSIKYDYYFPLHVYIDHYYNIPYIIVLFKKANLWRYCLQCKGMCPVPFIFLICVPVPSRPAQKCIAFLTLIFLHQNFASLDQFFLTPKLFFTPILLIFYINFLHQIFSQFFLIEYIGSTEKIRVRLLKNDRGERRLELGLGLLKNVIPKQ